MAGLNKGARGYYALDITDPNNPKDLWKVCSDSSLCEASDADIGYTYGYPVITKRASVSVGGDGGVGRRVSWREVIR